MNFLLEITKNDYSSSIINTKGFLETLGFGGQMLLLGVATVFAVLAIIWLCLLIFKVAFQGASGKEKAKPAPAPVVVEAAPAPVATQDEEIVAVIAAAIAMAESESSGIKFKVVSFKRK